MSEERSSRSGREDRHRSRDDDRSSERKRERERDRDHHKHRSEKRDPSSSEDERDRKRRKHHKKDKKDRKRDKKEKKDKKSSSSKKDEKRRELEEQAKAFLQKNASMGEATAVLTNSDYFARHAEFSLWLKEAKGVFFEDLSAAKSRKKFAKFVELWNRGSLPDKFYKGISTQDLEHNTRTGYQWGFTNRLDEKEALTLSSMRDEISRETNRPKGAARPPPRRTGSASTSTPSSSSTRGPSGPAVKHPDDEELDDEDKRRYDRLMRKKQEKSAQSYREAVMEELVPKADPGSREARLEKRQQKGGKGREDSPEIAESDLMGGGDSFQDRLRRQKDWRARKDSARAEEAQKKLAAHQAKEDAVMQQFRNMLAQRQANNPTL